MKRSYSKPAMKSQIIAVVPFANTSFRMDVSDMENGGQGDSNDWAEGNGHRGFWNNVWDNSSNE